MVNQSVQFKWTDVEKNTFSKIKTAVVHAPSLKSPDFEKDFILYTFYFGKGAPIVVLGVLHCTWLNSISRNFCWVFSPMRVSQDKYLCSFVWLCLYFFQWSFAYCYDVMMLNVLRSCITITIIKVTEVVIVALRQRYRDYDRGNSTCTETKMQVQVNKDSDWGIMIEIVIMTG